MMDLRPANSHLLFRFLAKSYPGSCPTALGPAACAASPAAAPAAGYETRQPQEADGNPCCVLNPAPRQPAEQAADGVHLNLPQLRAE